MLCKSRDDGLRPGKKAVELVAVTRPAVSSFLSQVTCDTVTYLGIARVGAMVGMGGLEYIGLDSRQVKIKTTLRKQKWQTHLI